jgi:hypothetical protein
MNKVQVCKQTKTAALVGRGLLYGGWITNQMLL